MQLKSMVAKSHHLVALEKRITEANEDNIMSDDFDIRSPSKVNFAFETFDEMDGALNASMDDDEVFITIMSPRCRLEFKTSAFV